MSTLPKLHSAAASLVVSLAFALNSFAATPSANGDIGPTLKLPVTASSEPDADGFINRWLLLEPIPGDGRVTDSATEAAAKKEYFTDQYTVIPKNGDKVTVGGAEFGWHAIDTSKYNINLYHFGYYLGKPTSNVVFWAVTVINCPQAVSGLRLAIGSNSSSVWWVNGQKVTAIYGDRQTVIDDGVSKKLSLKPGPNIVRVMVVNNGGMTDFCARFLDADGKPWRKFTQSLTATDK